MPPYFATCARGLEPVLAAELRQLGAEEVTIGRGGVHFHGDRLLLYQANLWLRTAIRVLQPIVQAEVRDYDELYAAARAVRWEDYLTVEQTFAVDSNVRDSPLTHSQYAARRVKDAICDHFRERLGRRPSVDPTQPMVGLNLHVHGRQAVLSLDSSWESLHKRGYRPIQTKATLNEALAAGLLMQSGWRPEQPLFDPMCGSGTFCIEAAWLALRRPPGLTRPWFGFFGWQDFDRAAWHLLREQARQQVRRELPAAIWGNDHHHGAVALAARCAAAAGVGQWLRFTCLDFRRVRPPPGMPPGWIVCNPPYGRRLERPEEDIFRELGRWVREHWPGWHLAVFAEGNDWPERIGLPLLHATPFYNGALRCTWAAFRVGDG